MTVELPGLPREPFSRWLAATLPELAGNGSSWRGQLLAGGLSNLTYRLWLTTGTVVLRRPPLADRLPSAHDMVREHTVQAALDASAVPVPDMIALCTDESVVGAPFYLMSDVDGTVLRSADDTAALDPATRSTLSELLVGTLVDLHAVDAAAIGLGEFGRGDDYCARQVRRWSRQWESSATRSLPDMDRLLARLGRSFPTQQRVSVVHGDYRLDNTIVGLAGVPRVNAVLDWELSTLGDPLADLGVFLTYWHESRRSGGSKFPPIAGLCAFNGFPEVDDLAESYALWSGRDLSELAYYLALGAMKLAVILEGVHARYLGGHTVGPGYELAGAAVPSLVARGLDLLA